MYEQTEDLYSQYSGVIELKTNDFKIEKKKVTVINNNYTDKNGLIIFYAPWCEHCQSIVEIWSEFAIYFKHKFIIGAVNCEDPNAYGIRDKLRISVYPTIYYVSKNGNLTKYKGEKEKDEIMEYICTKI